MKLATYCYGDGVGPGLVLGDEIADLRHLASSLHALLERLDEVAGAGQGASRTPLDPTRLLAPIPQPHRFIGVGLNYRDHAAETRRPFGDAPFLFAKLAGSVTAGFGPIPLPPGCQTLDYEGELALVIGRHCHRPSPSEVEAAIAGYMIVNDITIRSLAAPPTLLLAKSGRGFAPCGPWITTADEVSDPYQLALRTRVNGALRQDSNTREMHWRCEELVERIASICPLEPGDIIATGTPAGSGVGLDPPRYLEPGDIVRVEIEGLGYIENRIEAG